MPIGTASTAIAPLQRSKSRASLQTLSRKWRNCSTPQNTVLMSKHRTPETIRTGTRNETAPQRICKQTHRPWSVQAEQTWRADLIAQYGEDADEELFCIPARGGGAYLPLGMIENCQEPDIPVLRWKCADGFVDLSAYVREGETNDWLKESLDPILSGIKDTGLISYGMDFGRTGDLSVLWVLQEQQNLTLKTLFSVELSNVPHEQQKQILFYIIDRLPRFHHGAHDARGNGQSHAEAALQRYGSTRVECVMASPKWYGEWFPKYKRAYEDRTIAVPVSEDIIADHRLVVLNKGVPSMSDKRVKGSDGKYRHGDSAVAGVLAWAAARTEGEPPAGASLNKPERSFKRVWI